MPKWYSYAEQAKHYRESARDRGCTCPMMPPHIHLGDCPLFSPAADVPISGCTTPENGDGASDPVPRNSSTSEGLEGDRETMPREAGEHSPSLGAGAFDAFIRRAVEDSINAYEREEDHAEERHHERG